MKGPDAERLDHSSAAFSGNGFMLLKKILKKFGTITSMNYPLEAILILVAGTYLVIALSLFLVRRPMVNGPQGFMGALSAIIAISLLISRLEINSGNIAVCLGEAASALLICTCITGLFLLI